MKPYPIPTLTTAQYNRLWKKIDRRGEGDCWPWLGNTTRGVHGGQSYGIWHVGGRNLRPHRVTYTVLVGPIPDGLTLDHVIGRCQIGGLCCNPAHLEPVTQSVNSRRHQEAHRITHCKHGHQRKPNRPCKGCERMNYELWKERHPERLAQARQIQAAKDRDREDRAREQAS